jgi:hypothetical protein
MATTIEYNIKVNDGGATQTLGQLENELEGINQQLKGVEVGSDAFKDLSKKSQALTKDLEKTQNAIRGVTDEDKIRGFQGSIDILAGSVAGLTGAVGLLGLESEEFEKYTAYAANAIAFSEGIRTAAQGVVDLRGFLKSAGIQATIFGNLTKKALIATGIGALVVALGTIIAYWDEINDLVRGTTSEAKKLNKELNETLSTSEGIVGVLESEKSLIEAQDKSTLEVNKKLLKQLELQIGITEQLIEQAKIELFDEEQANKQVSFWEKVKIGALQSVGAYKQSAQAVAEALSPSSERTIELQTKINDLNIQRNQLQQKYIETTDEVVAVTDARTEVNSVFEQGVKAIGISTNENVAATELENSALTANDLATGKLIIKKTQAEAATRAETQAEKLKQQQLIEVGGAIQNLGAILDQESAAGKALAISTAIINTYLGVTEALKQKSTLPSPFDVITKIANVATILATGFKAVKGITSTPAQGSGGSAPSGGASVSAAVSSAPSVSQIQNAIPTGVSPEDEIASQGPIRAYVVSGDITSSQEATAQIESNREI